MFCNWPAYTVPVLVTMPNGDVIDGYKRPNGSMESASGEFVYIILGNNDEFPALVHYTRVTYRP